MRGYAELRRSPLLAIIKAVCPARAGGSLTRCAGRRRSLLPWYSTCATTGNYSHWSQGRSYATLRHRLRVLSRPGGRTERRPGSAPAMKDIAAAGVDEVVSSWWGRGSLEDKRLAAVLRAAKRRSLRVAVQLEPYEGRSDRSIAAMTAHILPRHSRCVHIYRSNDFRAGLDGCDHCQPTGLRPFADEPGRLCGARAGSRRGFYPYRHRRVRRERNSIKPCCLDFAPGPWLESLCAPALGPGHDAAAATWTATQCEGLELVTSATTKLDGKARRCEPALNTSIGRSRRTTSGARGDARSSPRATAGGTESYDGASTDFTRARSRPGVHQTHGVLTSRCFQEHVRGAAGDEPLEDVLDAAKRRMGEIHQERRPTRGRASLHRRARSRAASPWR